jgi:hypothetical protein
MVAQSLSSRYDLHLQTFDYFKFTASVAFTALFLTYLATRPNRSKACSKHHT